MRNLLVVTGAVAAGFTLGMGVGGAEPAANSTYNVVGELYAKAVAILRAQGVPTVFGGSVGSAVPQSQCLVKSQKLLSTGKIQLNLDCTEAALPDAPAATSATDGTQSPSATDGAQSPTAGNRPTPGAPGIITVIPTRVG